MQKNCDLVMRGGLTSGIVYPKAIVRLATEYQFRQVGGASAGAIAAALAAAAEVNRAGGGFDRLNKVPDELGRGLERYFQPYPKYGRIFGAILKLLKKHKSPGLGFFIWYGWSIKKALDDLPSSQFGLCPGTTTKKAKSPGLVNWLNQQLEFVAGRIATPDGNPPISPLTFGDLSNGGVQLRLIATNLSQRRPFNLPLGKGFYLRRSDMEWLLPDNVTAWILSKKPESPDGYVEVPFGADMPVILAVRMSLSYPLLFSAVPLYSADVSLKVDTPECKANKQKLWPNLFADGGLSSNFPIHYFDAVLPTRPTFGINLSDFNDCRNGGDSPTPNWNRIYMPAKAGSGLTYGVNPIDGVGEFLGSLLMTAKDWQDSVQMRMPGYRERIVHVALKPEEGGLNLAMEEQTLRDLMGLGDLAADRILNGHKLEPDKQPKFDLEVHRWRRVLAATGALDYVLPKITKAYEESAPSGDPSLGSIRDFLGRLAKNFDSSAASFQALGYRPPNAKELQKLIDRWEGVVTLSQLWDTTTLDPGWNLPSPEAGIRLRSQEF